MAQQNDSVPSRTCPVCGMPFTWRKRWRNLDRLDPATKAAIRRQAEALQAGIAG